MARTVTGASLVCAVVISACSATPPSADTVLVNAKVFTSNPQQLWAEAVAIRGDRVIGVGDNATIRAQAGSATRVIDLGGRTVVPGFNDAHQHVGMFPPPIRLKTSDDPTLDQIAAAFPEALESAGPGQMIRGTFGQNAWANPQFSRDWLDAKAPGHPVWLTAWTGHGVLLNSAALTLVGIGEDIKDPDGGTYGRDGKSRLNGRLEEYAAYLAQGRLSLTVDLPEAVGLYKKFAAEATSFGITTTQLMGETIPVRVMATRLIEANVPMRWRVSRFPTREAGAETVDSRPALPPQPAPTIDVRGMKWILDGSPVERLAFLRQPYADTPGERGRPNFSEARLNEVVGWAYGSEDPLLMHAVGDGAIDMYLTALERKGLPEVWRAKRPRVEHGDMMPPDLLARAKALGVVVVQNPAHLTLTEVFKARFDPARVSTVLPLRALVDAGIPLALGSDGPMNPFSNVMWAATHPTRPDQALTREQAVIAYTAGSAFAEFHEQDKGQVAVGMLADLAVLSKDLFTIPINELPAIHSELTMLGGEIVYQTGVVR